jgi:PKD domain
VISTQNPDSGHAPGPQVGVDPHGDAVAVWTAFDGTNNTAEAATKVAGGTWPAPSAAVTLSGDSMDPQGPALAVDPQGNAAVVWQQIAGGDFQIQAAGYDAAGPLLDGLSIPAQAVAGTPWTFSVTPVDAWSPVSSTSWGFGDGQSGSGETLTHTYPKPGAYKVTVTSTDGLGNPNTATGTITIAPRTSTAPPPSPPKLSQVSQRHKRWREGSKAATIARKRKSGRPPVGTSFSFRVNQAARVTLTFTQSSAGRKVKGKCQTPNKPNRKRPSCQRTLTRATLGFSVSAGHHAVKFQGHAGKKKIPLGAYTLHVEATNATQQHSRTATLKFTVVK